ncbi:MAG: sulfurtransferase [Planctomycetes bacterium]|nr:sulfurtransferase [Planctomycetota bacterium]
MHLPGQPFPAVALVRRAHAVHAMLPMHRRVTLAVGLAASTCLALGAPSCRRAEPVRTNAPARAVDRSPSIVVAADDLAARLATVLVLDVRGATEYARAHVAGAVHLPVSETFDANDGRRDRLAPHDAIRRALSRAGVDRREPVVVYDDGALRDAARVFWVIELCGHESVAVLDGGFVQWRAKGLPVATTASISARSDFAATFDARRFALESDVLAALRDDSGVVVDVRTQDEFVGFTPSFGRAGHVAGARHLDSASLVERRGGLLRLASPDGLARATADLPPARRAIVYANTGADAALAFLALRVLGREVALYDGAWKEWAADPRRPIETGFDLAAPR